MSVLNSTSIKAIHRMNAVALTAFIVLHFTVNLTAWGGVDLHGAWQEGARKIYQTNWWSRS